MRFRTLLPLVALVVASCAPSVNAVARQASKAAVDEGAEELTREDTQQSLQEAAQDPKLQEAATTLTEQVTEGVLRALESDQAHERIMSLTKAATEQMIASLGSEPTRARLSGLTSAIAGAALGQVATDMKDRLGPALRELVQDDMAQGMAAALQSQALQPALGRTAQTVAYNAVVGANDGLGAAWLASNGLLGEARGASGTFANLGVGWLWLPLAVLAMLTLMVIAAAVMMVTRTRRAQVEVERLESATLLLATALRERQQTAESDEIVTIVQEALASRAEQTGKHRILSALRLRKTG